MAGATASKAGRRTRVLVPAPAAPRKLTLLTAAQGALVLLACLSAAFTAHVLSDAHTGGSSPLQAALRRRNGRSAGLPGSRVVLEHLQEPRAPAPRAHSHADAPGGDDVMYDPLTDRRPSGASGDVAVAPGSRAEVAPPAPEPSTPTATAAPSCSAAAPAAPAVPSPDADEPHGGSGTYVDALELPLRRRAARSRPFPSGRAVEGAYKADDGDVALLLPGEDADTVVHSGLAYRAPTSHEHAGFVGGRATAAARRASEARADVAIVVISAPRWVALQRDGAQPHYFRFAGSCAGPGIQSRPCAAGVPVPDCVARLADACDADDACVGFSAAGDFHAVADAAGACAGPGIGDGVRHAALGGPSPLRPEEGLFLKAPLSFFAAPRAVDVTGGGGGGPAPRQARWYFAPGTSVAGGRSVGRAPAAAGAERPTPAEAAAACEATPGCAAFELPSGDLRDSVHPGVLTQAPAWFAFGGAGGGGGGDAGVYSRTPLPPLDYVTQTVVSLADELRPDCGAGGAFRGRAHLYVVDASAPELHEVPGAGGGGADDEEAAAAADGNATTGAAAAVDRRHRRGADADDFWLPAFASLRRAYGDRPCVTFLPATAYARLTETARPPHGRGEPSWQADNRGRALSRGNIAQTLDFVSGLRVAVASSPDAHVLVWEDDCFACAGTLATLGRAVDAVDAFDPQWGALKVGNGGSGMLFHADVAAPLITYLLSRRGSDNVDVSMWRFLHSGGYPDYLSRRTWSAHRGLRSSFGAGGQAWKRVHCGNELDWYWGWYTPCVPERMVAASAAAAAAGAGSATVAVPAAPTPQPRDAGLAELAADWRCSVWSAGSTGVMPKG